MDSRSRSVEIQLSTTRLSNQKKTRRRLVYLRRRAPVVRMLNSSDFTSFAIPSCNLSQTNYKPQAPYNRSSITYSNMLRLQPKKDTLAISIYAAAALQTHKLTWLSLAENLLNLGVAVSRGYSWDTKGVVRVDNTVAGLQTKSNAGEKRGETQTFGQGKLSRLAPLVICCQNPHTAPKLRGSIL